MSPLWLVLFWVRSPTPRRRARPARYWWTEITYVGNVVPWPVGTRNSCLGVTWYLANDVQFFVVGVPFVALLYYRPRAGTISLAVMALASCAYTLWVGFHDKLRFSFFAGMAGTAWSRVYVSPWTRCPVYIIGVLCGFLWHRYFRGRVVLTNQGGGSESVEKHWLARNPAALPVAAVVSVACLALPVYGTYWAYQDVLENRVPEWADHLYLAFGRPSWVIGLALMCWLCFCGYGGFVNDFLAWSGWTVPSRLTFCAYMSHPWVLTWLYGARDVPPTLTELELAITFMGVLFATFVVAFALHMLVEAPFRNLESWSRRKRSSSRSV